MEKSLRRRLDAIVALLAVVAVASVTGLLLSFRVAGIVVAFFVLFVGVVVGLFVSAELY